MFGYAEGEHPRLVKLFRMYSNLCDHNPPTLQTDIQTDRRHAIAIPRFALSASRGKNQLTCKQLNRSTRRINALTVARKTMTARQISMT